MWHPSIFQKYNEPDLDLLIKLGTQLKVDAVLLFMFYIVENEQIMKACLIDVKNKKLHQSTETDDFGKNYGWGLQYYNELPQIVKKVILSVFEKFIS